MAQVLGFGESAGYVVDDYGARGARSVHLGSGSGETHVYALHFEPGGAIGSHETGFGQLFIVVSGDAWVEVAGDRSDLAAGQSAIVPRGVLHSKGSEGGAEVIMVQVFDLESGTGSPI